MVIKATAVQFDNVAGWTGGPLKPTAESYTGTPANVISSLTDVLSNISNLAEGEVLQIIVTAKGDE